MWPILKGEVQVQAARAWVCDIIMAWLTRGVLTGPSVLGLRPCSVCQAGCLSVHAHHISLVQLKILLENLPPALRPRPRGVRLSHQVGADSTE